jgi:Suppressor of fused protein (SUFU)/Tetratricopeptide repeat
MSRAAADALVEEASVLFRDERFSEALAKYERAVTVFPEHPLGWKGVGQSLLCLGRPHDAARAFDRAIGLTPNSATALWAGALAHAEIGNRVVAQNYLRRTLVLQPTWIEMAKNVAHLVPFLQVSVRSADLIRAAFGAYSTRTYRHTANDAQTIEVARVADSPKEGRATYITVGLSNREWGDRARVELVLASTIDLEACGQILANLAFHLGDTSFYPEPGVMVRDVVAALRAGDLSLRLPHVYLRAPVEWPVRLPLDAGPPAITLVQVVPVAEGEYQAWRRGVEVLESSLAARRVDLADLKRTIV